MWALYVTPFRRTNLALFVLNALSAAAVVLPFDIMIARIRAFVSYGYRVTAQSFMAKVLSPVNVAS